MDVKDLKTFVSVIQTKNSWFNLDTKEIVTTEDLKQRVTDGLLSSDQVSTQPMVFPVFGDVDRAVNVYLPQLQIIAKDLMTPDTCSCILNIRGFKNPGNSCFMDSTLVAMFAIKDSPFTVNMIDKQYSVEEPHDLVCNHDKDEDNRLRLQIQDMLRKDWQDILNDVKNKMCSELRKLIGKKCLKDDSAQDLSRGDHDPSEFYTKLMAILDYEPIKFSFTTFRSKEYSAMERTPENISIQQGPMLSSLRVDDINSVHWPSSWAGIVFAEIPDKKNPLFRFAHTQTRINSADVIVINLDRSDPTKGNKYVNPKHVEIEQVINVDFPNGGSQKYSLCSVVYSPDDGHWATMLKCDGIWYDYNDMITGNVISKNKVEKIKAEKILKTRGVLFFYYLKNKSRI